MGPTGTSSALENTVEIFIRYHMKVFYPTTEKRAAKPPREAHSCQQARALLESRKRADEKERCKLPITPTFKKASSKLFECRCDKRDIIYLCERCSLKLSAKEVITHLSGFEHKKINSVVVNLREKTYNDIFKQSFQSAIATLRALSFRSRVLRKRPSVSPPVKPVSPSAAHQAQRVNSVVKVVGMKMNESKDGGAALNGSKCNATPASTDSNEALAKTCVSGLQSADKRTFRLNVSTEGANEFCLHRSTGNTRKHFPSNAICRKTPSSKLDTSTVSLSAPTETLYTFNANLSNTAASAKSEALSTPLKRASAPTSKANPASFSMERSAEVDKAAHRTSLRAEHSRRCSGAAPKVSASLEGQKTSATKAKMPQTSHEHRSTDTSKVAQLTNSVSQDANVESHTCKKSLTASPHPSASTSELKSLKESSQVSETKKQTSGNSPKVGLNELIVVSWEGKQQVYCRLCSVRLKRSDHLISTGHQYNYVKMKFPGWTAKASEFEDKLNDVINYLAQIEREIGTQSAQKLEVKKDEYKKLALLPAGEAVQMVKAMLRPRDPRVSSPTPAGGRDVSGPCEVSSSNDVHVSCNVVSQCLSNQPDQADKVHQLVQITYSDLKSDLQRKATLGESPPVQSSDCEKDPCDPREQQLPSSASGENHQMGPVPAPSSQTEDVPETIKEKQTNPDAETRSDATLWNQSAAVKKEKTPGCTQQWERDPPAQNPAKAPESAQISSPVQIRGAGLQAARVDRGQQNQPGPSHKTEQPGEHSGSQTLTRASVGRKALGCSHLSFYLKASQQDMKSVIGMGSVWECRGNSLKTIFLCESCEENISCREICRHMVSPDHQLRYMWKTQPEFLQMFWFNDDLLPGMKMSILKDAVQKLSERERLNKVDAQCVLLGAELHNYIRMASFIEALKMVKIISEGKPTIFCRPSVITYQPSVNEPEKSDSAEPAFLGGPDVVKPGRIPLDGAFSTSKAGAVISPVPGVGTHLDPPETRSGSALQTQVQPAVCRHQRPDPRLQLNRKEEESELTNIVPVSGPSLGVSPQNKCPPPMKRPADVPVGTLHRALSSSSQDPLPAKWSPNNVLIKSEPLSSTISDPSSVTPAGNSKPPSVTDEYKEPKRDQRLSELKNSIPTTNVSSGSAPVTETPTSCSTTSSRWDSKTAKPKRESAANRRRLDSKCLLVKATVKKKRPSAQPEAVTEEERQIVISGVCSASTDISLYLRTMKGHV